MKRLCLMLFLLIFFSFYLIANDIIDDEENMEHNRNNIKEYDLSSFSLELSCFNYFNIGLGYNWGTCSTFSGHYSAIDYGFFIEYKTIKELHLRSYFDLKNTLLLVEKGLEPPTKRI